MKNPINIVLSKEYQLIFNQTFVRNGSGFAQHGQGELMTQEQAQLKAPVLMPAPVHRLHKPHNQIINDAFIFWADDQVMLGLAYSPKLKSYTGKVFLLDDEGIINVIGTNVFNMAELLLDGLSNIDTISDYPTFCKKVHDMFGDFDKSLPDFLDLSDDYPDYDW